jgi:hypothetical protein
LRVDFDARPLDFFFTDPSSEFSLRGLQAAPRSTPDGSVPRNRGAREYTRCAAEECGQPKVDQIDTGQSERDVSIGHHAAVEHSIDGVEHGRIRCVEYLIRHTVLTPCVEYSIRGSVFALPHDVTP